MLESATFTTAIDTPGILGRCVTFTTGGQIQEGGRIKLTSRILAQTCNQMDFEVPVVTFITRHVILKSFPLEHSSGIGFGISSSQKHQLRRSSYDSDRYSSAFVSVGNVDHSGDFVAPPLEMPNAASFNATSRTLTIRTIGATGCSAGTVRDQHQRTHSIIYHRCKPGENPGVR